MKEKSEKIGKLLANRLRETVTFEGSKKRGVLKRDPNHARITPLRVYADVLVAIKRAKTNSKSPRPTDQLKRFLELLAELDDDSTNPIVDSWVWPWLEVSEEYEEQDLLADRDELISRIESAIKVLTDSAEYKLDQKGGRRSDPCLDSFLLNLAFIYRQYTGYRPTYSEDVHGGGQQSSFFWFVSEVLRSFADDEPFATWATQDGALQIAIKRMSKYEREIYVVGADDPILQKLT